MPFGTNQLSLQNGKVLFVYDHVLKDPDAFILSLIAKHYPTKFKEYVDIVGIRTLDQIALQKQLILRTTEDPLEWVSLKPFDFKANYEYLYKKSKNMYRDSIPLSMYEIVNRFAHSYCINHVYIWNQVEDIRQRYDLLQMLGKNANVEYVTGNYKKVLKKLKPDVVYDYSAKRVAEVNEYEEFNHIFFGVANYQYNFDPPTTLIPLLKYKLSYRKNISDFRVWTIGTPAIYKG